VREDADVQAFDDALNSLQHCIQRHRQWDGTLRPIVRRDE
jgi:hypothetical protein